MENQTNSVPKPDPNPIKQYPSDQPNELNKTNTIKNEVDPDKMNTSIYPDNSNPLLISSLLPVLIFHGCLDEQWR